MAWASCGLVWKSTLAGTCASARRSTSLAHSLAGTAPGPPAPGPCRWRRPRRPRPGSSLSARPCPSTGVAPGRLGALLEEPGLIHHQHPAWVAEPLHDIAAHVVAQRVWVPADGGQQPLHSVRGRLAGVLGQLPAILAVDPTQQPAQEPSSPPADLRAGEPWADPLAQPLELRRPALDSASTLCLHRPLLSRKRATYPTRSAAAVLGRGLRDRSGPRA